MKKRKEFGLNTITDLKVFILFLIDHIRYPVDHTTVMKIIEENTEEISLDFEACLVELVDSGHLLFDELDGEKYYMISETGRVVASELYDNLDKGFREKSLRTATKYMSLSESGSTVSADIEKTASGRYRVTLESSDREGEIMKTSLTVTTLAEAEAIKKNFEQRPTAVYRGILFSATGRIDYVT